MLIFSAQGIKAPTTEAVKESFETIFVNIFGNDVNLNPQSINGLLIQELTNNAVDNNNNLLNLFNEYSIVTSTGIFLDYIGLNYNIVRNQGSFSLVQITMTGGSGTVIPEGTEVSDGTNVYKSIDSYVLNASGTYVGTFTALIRSSYLPLIGSVTKILSFVSGLDSVINVGIGDIAGKFPERDADYRVRIVESAFDTQRGTNRSLSSALSLVSNDFILIENFKSIPQTVTGVDIDPHSIWVSSNQGTDAEIATTIFDYKSIGCGTVGTTSFIIDSYTINFNRPTLVPINFVVQVKSVPEQPANLIDLIKETILNSMQIRSKIGKVLYSSEFISDLDNAGVVQIEILTINGTTSVTPTIEQLFTTSEDKIDVQVVEE